MNRYAKAAMKRTGKPYGGHLHYYYPVLGIAIGRVAHGQLQHDPLGRFIDGAYIRTSYLVKVCKTYIETRNTIYTYTEEVYHEPEK